MCVSCQRRALRAAHPPKSSSRGFIWRHFTRRFREAYRTSCPWDGAGHQYPKRTSNRAVGLPLPSAAENARAVVSLKQLGDLDEIRRRIDRMFAHPRHRAAGVDLKRVANWWHHLASDEILDRKTRQVCGRAS